MYQGLTNNTYKLPEEQVIDSMTTIEFCTTKKTTEVPILQNHVKINTSEESHVYIFIVKFHLKPSKLVF